jgi:hypothetical protein
MSAGNRLGRPRRSSVRDSSMLLESQNLPYWRRQHTVRELLSLQRTGRLNENRRKQCGGDRSSTAPGVASVGVEGERTLSRQSSLIAVTPPLYLSSSTPPCPSSLLRPPQTPMSANVSGVVTESRAFCSVETASPSVTGDTERVSVSLRLRSSSCHVMLNDYDGVTNPEQSPSENEWDDFIGTLIASSNDIV